MHDVAEHFRTALARGDAARRSPPPKPPEPAGDVELQVVRTVPEKVYTRAAARATSGSSSRTSARCARRERLDLPREPVPLVARDRGHPRRQARAARPTDDFRLLLVLPAKPNNGGDDTRGVLGELIEADDGDGPPARLHAVRALGRPRRPGLRARQDRDRRRRWLTVGSANLNEHSLFNDTEMNVVTHDAGVARATRLRLWSRAPRAAGEDIAGDPTQRDRRALEADQRRAAPAAARGPAAHPPARAAPARLAALGPRCSARCSGLLVDG